MRNRGTYCESFQLMVWSINQRTKKQCFVPCNIKKINKQKTLMFFYPKGKPGQFKFHSLHFFYFCILDLINKISFLYIYMPLSFINTASEFASIRTKTNLWQTPGRTHLSQLCLTVQSCAVLHTDSYLLDSFQHGPPSLPGLWVFSDTGQARHAVPLAVLQLLMESICEQKHRVVDVKVGNLERH